MEKQLEEKRSLEIIHDMISKAKGKVSDNSKFYLLWGWLVLVSSLLHFGLIQLDYSMPWLPWVILMPLGGIIAAIMGSRMEKKKGHTAFLDKAMGYIWGGFVITILIALFHGPKIGWEVSYSVLISLYGLATFISGGLLRFRPLVIGGISAWIIAVISFHVSMEILLLLIALSMVTSYLIPGYMLKQHQHAAKA